MSTFWPQNSRNRSNGSGVFEHRNLKIQKFFKRNIRGPQKIKKFIERNEVFHSEAEKTFGFFSSAARFRTVPYFVKTNNTAKWGLKFDFPNEQSLYAF